MSFDEYGRIPVLTLKTLTEYVFERIPVGGFLEAVLSNDLAQACARADYDNRAAFFDIVKWLHNKAPLGCWGSPERYQAWIHNRKPTLFDEERKHQC